METNLREFHQGDIVRHGGEPTDIMQIGKQILRDPSGRASRYYGKHVLGGMVAADATDIEAASAEDMAIWLKCNPEASPTDTPLKWAVRTFGVVALHRKERAMRLLEEAIEFAQAEGIKRPTILRQVFVTFDKPPGDPLHEFRQVAMTAHAAAENLGEPIDEAVATEFNRVLGIPQEEWDRRHAIKAADGRANLSPGIDPAASGTVREDAA